MEKRYKSDFKRFKRMNNFVKGKEILDIGSSEGFLHKLFVRHNQNKRIFTADRSNSDFNMDLNKKWKINKKFDTIIAGEIIEHLDNPIEFIEKCRKVLKKQGTFILTTPNSSGLQYILNPSWCLEDHNFAFTLPMIRRIIEESGFKISHVEYINAFWINNPLKIIPELISRLRTDILIVAEKI